MFTPYMHKISPDAVILRKFIEHAMTKIPEMQLPSGKDLSCHIVCRILSKLLGIPYKDGYLEFMCEHSWLVKDHYIIDPYPIGVVEGPLILETRYGLVWEKLYKEQPLETVTTAQFKRDLAYAFKQVHWRQVWELVDMWAGDPLFRCRKCNTAHIGLLPWMKNHRVRKESSLLACGHHLIEESQRHL